MFTKIARTLDHVVDTMRITNKILIEHGNWMVQINQRLLCIEEHLNTPAAVLDIVPKDERPSK